MIASATDSRTLKTAGALARLDARNHTHRRLAYSGVGFDVVNEGRTRRAFTHASGQSAGADRHLTSTRLAKLREMCRSHVRNSALMAGLLNRAMDNIVGPAFRFRAATGDAALDAAADDYMREAMTPARCDAAGRLSFPAMLRTSLGAEWTDGDCLLVKRPDGTMLTFEADQLVTPTGSAAGQREKNARIVQGVELDDLNRHIAYHVRRRLTRGDYGFSASASQNSTRVKAADAFFPGYRPRFNQVRGYPYLAAALSIFDRLDGYIDAETLAAQIAAKMAVQITRQPTEADFDGAEDNEIGDADDLFTELQRFEDGMVFDLEPGEEVKTIESSRPGAQFDPYTITVCRIVGAAVGFPLELLLLDFSRTNYSSARASLTEARRTFRQWQSYAADQLAMPWHRWQITRGIASGDLPPRAEMYLARPQWPAWNYIDPLKEAKGNLTQVEMRTKSPSECIREAGRDPDETFREIASDLAKMEALGILPAAAAATSSSAPYGDTDNDAADAAEDEAQK